MTSPNPLTREDLLELAALDALDLLDEFDSAHYTRSFHDAPARVQDEIKQRQAELAADTTLLPEEGPTPSLRPRVLDAVPPHRGAGLVALGSDPTGAWAVFDQTAAAFDARNPNEALTRAIAQLAPSAAPGSELVITELPHPSPNNWAIGPWLGWGLAAGGTWGEGWSAMAAWHDFSADNAFDDGFGNKVDDYGTELDVQVTYKASWKQSFGVKAAVYSADDTSTLPIGEDTSKIWFWTGYKF